MTWWAKTKNFVVKYWQWIVMFVTAIAFYLLGRSKDAKKQQVKFFEKWKQNRLNSFAKNMLKNDPKLEKNLRKLDDIAKQMIKDMSKAKK